MEISWSIIEADKTPKLFHKCPYCNEKTLFLPIDNNFKDLILDYSYCTNHDHEAKHLCLKKCSNPDCNQVVAFLFLLNANITGCDIDGEPEYEQDIVYIKTLPEVDNIVYIEHVPANINNSFYEAQKCFQTGCYMASAVMIRKTLEELCEDKKIKGKNLEQKINNLISANLIPEELGNDLHELRELGNDGAHIELKNFDKISNKEVKAAIEAVKSVLIMLYESKGNYKTAMDKLKSGKIQNEVPF